jgi:hypothetical protein
MASRSASSLAAACIELYSGSERLVEQFVISYTSYICVCLLACVIALVMNKRRGNAHAKKTADATDAALSLSIPYLPSLERLLFLAPLFLATSSLFLLLVRVYDIRARPFFYTSQKQFELASFSSQMFTAFLVLIPIGTLFSSLARMVFMFRLVVLCKKIGITHHCSASPKHYSICYTHPQFAGEYTFDCMKVNALHHLLNQLRCLPRNCLFFKLTLRSVVASPFLFSQYPPSSS